MFVDYLWKNDKRICVVVVVGGGGGGGDVGGGGGVLGLCRSTLTPAKTPRNGLSQHNIHPSRNNNDNNLFYIVPQQQSYQLLALHESTNIMFQNTHQYIISLCLCSFQVELL